ncbi:hypothetical protein ACROYT_G001863 [Oculina patagonica]
MKKAKVTGTAYAFISGDDKERIRRNMESSRDSQQPEDNGIVNKKENGTSASPPESPSLTTPLPTLNNEDNFFNPYCALAINATNIVCGLGQPGPEEPGPLPKPFSLVMDVDFSGDQPDKETFKVRKHKVVCLEGYVYDFHLQMCRPGIAPSDFNSLGEKLFSVSVWMQSNTSSLLIPLVTEINFKEAIMNNFNIS